MARNVLLFMLLLGCCSSLAWGQQQQQQQWWWRGHELGSEKPQLGDVDRKASMKIFARYSTTTEALISVITSVVPYLCYSTTGTATCLGKRRRRNVSPVLPWKHSSYPDPLDSSILGRPEGEEEAEENDATNKFFFTIVRTTTSTFTFTSTSTNISITVSAQALCTFAGFTGPVC